MKGTVRRASPEDADALGRVHYAAHLETYTGRIPDGVIESWPPEQRATMWTRTILDALDTVWAAVTDGEIVGFASSCPSRDDDPPRELELASIYLLAAHHGSGLGQALLDSTIGDRPASLWVLDENPRAIAFYRRNGFEADGAEKFDTRWGNVCEIRMVR